MRRSIASWSSSQRIRRSSRSAWPVGPLDLDDDSPHFGVITTTPKPGWAGTDFARCSHEARRTDRDRTDVGAAALGEGRFGAAQGLDTFCYVTVGTGIGGGVVVRGEVAQGLLHPEFGHMRVQHDRDRDPFAGAVPSTAMLRRAASGEALRHASAFPPTELPRRRLGAGGRLPRAGSRQRDLHAVTGADRSRRRGHERTASARLVRDRVRVLAGDYFDSPALRDGIVDYVVRPRSATRPA